MQCAQEDTTRSTKQPTEQADIQTTPHNINLTSSLPKHTEKRRRMVGDHGGGIAGEHDDDDDDDDDDNRGGGGAGSDDDAAAVVLLLPVMGTLLHAAIRLGVCSITLWISK